MSTILKEVLHQGDEDEGDEGDEGDTSDVEEKEPEKEPEENHCDDDIYAVKCLSNNKSEIYQPACCEKDILPKLPTGFLVIGKSGSGKTMAILNMLSNEHMLKDAFDFTYMFVGIKPDPEMIKIIDLPKENIREDFTEEEVGEIMLKMEKTVDKMGMKNTPSVLFIFDDILGRDKFLRSKTFTKLVTTNRHMNITYIIMSQYFRKLPSVVRTNASMLMVFPSSMIELEKLAEEQTPPNMSKKSFIKVAQHATSSKYSFLSINTKADVQSQLRKGFNSVLNLNE